MWIFYEKIVHKWIVYIGAIMQKIATLYLSHLHSSYMVSSGFKSQLRRDKIFFLYLIYLCTQINESTNLTNNLTKIFSQKSS